jgi:hypothetical protein
LPARGVGPTGLEELLAGGHEVVGAGADPLGVTGDDAATPGQRVEQRLHAVDEDRGQRLHALDGDAVGDLLEQVGDARQAVCQSRLPARERVGEQQLAARRCPQARARPPRGALVGDPEPPDLLDRVSPELHAQRVFLGRREDVEDAAADRELAAPLDEVGAA